MFNLQNLIFVGLFVFLNFLAQKNDLLLDILLQLNVHISHLLQNMSKIQLRCLIITMFPNTRKCVRCCWVSSKCYVRSHTSDTIVDFGLPLPSFRHFPQLPLSVQVPAPEVVLTRALVLDPLPVLGNDLVPVWCYNRSSLRPRKNKWLIR